MDKALVIVLIVQATIVNCQQFPVPDQFSDFQLVVEPRPDSRFVADFFTHGSSSRDTFGSARRVRMSESCLACICVASTGCDLRFGCVAKDQYCGPFLISRPYWLDAGSPVILGDAAERPAAFQDCAMDPICSAQTVRKYMTKFQKDCTGDRFVTCDDLALIHLTGPYGSECSNPSPQKSGYFKKFKTCWNAVQRLSAPPDESSVNSVEDSGQRL